MDNVYVYQMTTYIYFTDFPSLRQQNDQAYV